jgi:hypothetical protein
MKSEDTHDSRRPGAVIPWTWLSLGLAVVAVTAIGTLAIIVSVKDVDVLSTIALALAVLAFAAQLIVSLAQAQGSAEQLNSTERINSETQATLADVRASARALLATQSHQFDRVLSAALRTATEDAVLETTVSAADPPGENGSRIDPELVADRIEANIRDYLASVDMLPDFQAADRHARPPRWILDRPTSGEAARAFEFLKKLDHFEIVALLSRVAFLERGHTSLPAVQKDTYPMSKFIECGLYRWGTGPMLTDDGRAVVRLLYHDMSASSWFRNELHDRAEPT